MGIIFCWNAWKHFGERCGEKMKNQIFPHEDTILEKNSNHFHPQTFQVILLCPVPLVFWQTICAPSSKTSRGFRTMAPMQIQFQWPSWGYFPPGLLPPLDQRLLPWWQMWEEFCALVLRSVHTNHGAWKLATRVVLWVGEANCPVFSAEPRLLSMPKEGQHL